MKIFKPFSIYNIFIIISIIFIINNNIYVVADDSVCYNALLNKLFGYPLGSINLNSTNFCGGSKSLSGTGWTSASTCSSGTISILYVTSTTSKSDVLLTYSDFSCFNSTFSTMTLTNLKLEVDVFGFQSDKGVAKYIRLFDCVFGNTRISSSGNSISKDTTDLLITNDDSSNLEYIDFLNIINLNNFQLSYDSNAVITHYPIITNDLSPLQNGLFSAFALTTNQIPSFHSMNISTLTLNLVNVSGGNTFSNLNTLGSVITFNFNFNSPIDYPIELSSSNNHIQNLRLGGALNKPSSMIDIQPGLNLLSIGSSTSFNINGVLPFIIQSNSSLTQLYIYNIGLTTFPTIPINIETIDIEGNNFSLSGPVTIPNLSGYKSLKNVLLKNTGLSGTISESFCSYTFLFLGGNNFSGSLPQCLACYTNYVGYDFSNNPSLSVGVCLAGSIVPNLSYDYNSKNLTLFGSNLGVQQIEIINLGIYLQVKTPQTLFSAIWNDTLPDTINFNLGTNTFTLATKYLTPVFTNITKSGTQYTFKGSNFSYNLADFKLFISSSECKIIYCDFNTIQCTAPSTLPIGQDIVSTIQNTNSTEIVKFTVNTADDGKTTIVKQCDSDCNVGTNQGVCSSTTGTCICSQYYTGVSCGTPSQFLSSISSTTTNGGLVEMYGWFGNSPDVNGISIKIGSLSCSVSYVNSSFSNCTIGAGSGTQNVVIIQNGYTWTGENIFHYTDLNFKCPKDCSNQGVCNSLTGQCKCNTGYGGFDCNSKVTTTDSSSTTGGTPTPAPSESVIIPVSNTTINETVGSATISNQQTTFAISILSLVEFNISNNIINEFNLVNNWNTSLTANNDNKYVFNQTIQESCIITYTIEEVKVARNYTFAGLDLTLDKGSLKITVSINNYPFSNALNTLQLRLESSVGENDNKQVENNACNDKSTQVNTEEIDKNQLLNYVTISKNQKTLYGRFINRVMSGTRETFITTSVVSENSQSLIIGLNLPHSNNIIIDPDFSALVSSEFKSCDGSSNGRPSWVLPVAIVIPCVGVALIIVVGAIIYRKNRTSILLAKDKYSLKSFRNK